MKKILLTISVIIATGSANAQTDFITKWTDASLITSLTFDLETSPAGVNYSWIASPSGNTGGGTLTQTSFGPNTISINSQLGDTVTIAMAPTNLKRYGSYSPSPDNSKLIDVVQWGSANWTSMAYAFYGCVNLTITATDVPNLAAVTNLSWMFAYCEKLNGPININSWNTGNVTNMRAVFHSATLFNQPIGTWNTVNVIDMSYMFSIATSFNQPIGTWNTINVIDMRMMFEFAKTFNQPIGTWNTTNVNGMSYMFNSANVFNQNISPWNTANVTTMRGMFQSATSFNQPIGSWNTANVKYIDGMFANTILFNQPIGTWNTANVTSMNYAFNYATSFNQPIGSWNTANVKYIDGLFANATSFNQPIGNWNTANITSMNYAFDHATSFNQNIGTWDISKVIIVTYVPNQTNMSSMLDSCGLDCENYSATLNGWNTNTSIPIGSILGAAGLEYGASAATAHANLTGVKSWIILGDIASNNECNSKTGLTTKNNIALILYPNPATNSLIITAEATLGTIKIASVLGVVVMQLTTTKNETNIDVSQLPSGIYFINCNGTSEKFVKE